MNYRKFIPKKILTLLILSGLFFLFNFLLNWYMPKSLALDVKFAYSAKVAYESLTEMGLEGRSRYLLGIWALDFPYMFIYLALLSGIIKKVWRSERVLILPFLLFAFDVLENFIVTLMLVNFPDRYTFLGCMASIATTSKWLFALLYVLVVFWGLAKNKKRPVAADELQ
ncbi:hypothetical protein PBT90_05265 [Algoriphagus halophytocola]|uniref:Uncharacterized protein n=1 Tax=Algoriphagus halophytocola TaxID=2991499 RepID=A0ABY6MGA0_9BACT|nr:MULTISPECIES: hypothetical protein [unclassified Algoriphagus]UZD22827.1 hypothetical protein OM944_19525 [Algoriphagus sp. TR-M5]WBL44093.1 hypothetical protein PBT90_05265 [Algoriphagus sp. TR-M9]